MAAKAEIVALAVKLKQNHQLKKIKRNYQHKIMLVVPF